MLERDQVDSILITIGAFTCLGVAFLFVCLCAFLGLLAWDGYLAKQKSKFGKHQRGDLIKLPSDGTLGFFNDPNPEHFIEFEPYTREKFEKDDTTLKKRFSSTDPTQVGVSYLPPLPKVVPAPGWEQESEVDTFNMKDTNETRRSRKADREASDR